MAYPANTATIHAAMAALAGGSPRCSISTLAPSTVGGTGIRALEITGPSVNQHRPVVLIIAGQHAREWAPVDSLLSFAEKLVGAYDAGTAMRYPAFRDGAVSYASIEISKDDVRSFVNHLVLVIVPLVNPDGRTETRRAGGQPMWRGNRNVSAATNGCSHHGIDLNRNYDLAWDTSVFYSAADEARITAGPHRSIVTSCQLGPANQIYRGHAAASENETTAIQALIDSRKPSLALDIHSYGRWVLLPWGIARNQSADPTQSFLRASHNRTAAVGSGRTVTDLSYREFVPNTAAASVASRMDRMGDHIVDTIKTWAGPNVTAIARSTYRKIFIPQLYELLGGAPHPVPVPGSVIDYAFARQFKPGAAGPVYAFGLECGSAHDGEAGFHPPAGVRYQKIEREVHAAVFALLDAYFRTVVRGAVPIGPLP